MSAEVAKVLREAADLIEPPGRWTQKAPARDEDGRSTFARDAHAVCWCAYGAVVRMAGSDRDRADRPLERLRQRVAGPSLGVWNDDPQRTQDEVVAALRAAADEADEEQTP